MAILTTINGIPLFSTIKEALVWASKNSLSGYHTHKYIVRKALRLGYMGGTTHALATQQSNIVSQTVPLQPQTPPVEQRQVIRPTPTPTPIPVPTPTPTPVPRINYNTGGGSGGGGGY
mgnify:CR=1 FL=1